MKRRHLWTGLAIALVLFATAWVLIAFLGQSARDEQTMALVRMRLEKLADDLESVRYSATTDEHPRVASTDTDLFLRVDAALSGATVLSIYEEEGVLTSGGIYFLLLRKTDGSVVSIDFGPGSPPRFHCRLARRDVFFQSPEMESIVRSLSISAPETRPAE